jgi:protein-disulfide isomerase
MMSREPFLNILTAVSVSCCVAVSSVFLVRQFRGASAAPVSPPGTIVAEDRRVANWQELKSIGHRIGPERAAVTIVEFGDFECPACRGFFANFEAVRAKYPDKIALVYRHWPLSYHRFAYPSARAAECAAGQRKFPEFYKFVFSKQDSLGLITFSDIAKRIGIADVWLFEKCVARPGTVAAIENDIAAARTLEGRGTPTLVINGTLPGRLPDANALEQLVRNTR